jgi:hypothetical protein
MPSNKTEPATPTSILKFSLANLLTLAISLLSVGVTFGTALQKISSVETRVNELEIKDEAVHTQLSEQITQLRVEQGKVANDVSWLRENASAE